MKFKKFKIATLFTLALSLVGGAIAGAAQVQASDFPKFADVASYQSSDEYYFKNLATGNVSGVVVKLTQGSTDGDNYINPKAGAQIKSAKAAGMKVSLYHYAKYNGSADAKAEADFFANAATRYGLDKNTVMVADVEDSSLTNPYADTVAFQNELAARGFNNQVVYSMASWFWANKLPRNYPIWVANYGVSQPGVDNAAAWQYTSNYNGMSLDMSYDFTGLFTNNSVSQAPAGNKSVVTALSRWNGVNAVHKDGSFAQWLYPDSQWVNCGETTINGQTAYQIGNDVYIYAGDTH
ncbi:hypothetical protein FHQ08_02055 [Lactobacillus sp. CC-MHH1034]|uniref:GH25 family lysozyme n=1 Tax=Agrilactobacillus fermenti TaxID=2586909 RepID=UPI001E315E0B|nr:GH25 family lysozyme [Agrilactobacillus fermenti]MCD2255495.1 hypothetical protein [Agrilactobacillus fermenti]